MGQVQPDANGRLSLQYTDVDGRNLLGLFDGFQLTQEPQFDDDPSPGTIIYSGQQVPNALSDIRTITVVSGDATAEGFDGELNMNVVEGDIFFRDTPGLVSANLVNGSISGTFDSLLNDAEFAAVDGEIELTVPRDVHISVSTLSGDISIPGGNVVHEMVGSSADYGEGEFEISISTVSGDVEVTH